MSICARCEHWTLKADPARAAAGEGHCTGFLAAAMDFTDWDQPRCGIYLRAKQMAPREKWIDARIAASSDAESGAKVAPD